MSFVYFINYGSFSAYNFDILIEMAFDITPGNILRSKCSNVNERVTEINTFIVLPLKREKWLQSLIKILLHKHVSNLISNDDSSIYQSTLVSLSFFTKLFFDAMISFHSV